ncbi:MAG: hypothetical protein KAI47_13755 [Deltaproteobacteria bacterium]|nr:hypothetical protein [Deltaproteobacteria bacterium]
MLMTRPWHRGAVAFAALPRVVLFALLGGLVACAGCSETPASRPHAEAGAVDGALLPKDGSVDGAVDGALSPKDGVSKTDALRVWDGTFFPAGSIWYQDHSKDKVASNSDAIITWLDDAGGFGGGELQIDFSIEVLYADASTAMRTFEPTEDHYTPDCDTGKVPVPVGGALEGESGYECTTDGDCHLIVVDPLRMKLYEMWRANIVSGTFSGGCLAIWDMNRVYGPKGRGDQCTSADAAGFPIAPLLFSADEVKAGHIDHAIRFILPNARIRTATMVRPATHGIKGTGGGDDAPPYGVHFRLKAGVDISGLSAGAQVVARALKKYGMFHGDGGTIALTAQSDRSTKAKWTGLLGARDLASLKVTDFEVIDHGPTISVTYDCVREP